MAMVGYALLFILPLSRLSSCAGWVATLIIAALTSAAFTAQGV